MPCYVGNARLCNAYSQPSGDESNKTTVASTGLQSLCHKQGEPLLRSRHAPVTMESPSTLLALLAAVFGATTAAAFRKLAGIFFPLAALVISALPYPSPGIIFAAKVSHHNARPVLHVSRVVAYGELLHQREEIKVIGEEVFGVLLVLLVYINVSNFLLLTIRIKCCQLLVDLEFGDEVALLEVGA